MALCANLRTGCSASPISCLVSGALEAISRDEMALRFTASHTRPGYRMNALPDRYASDELLLRNPSDGRTLAQRLSRRYAARITGAFVVPGREGSFAPLPD